MRISDPKDVPVATAGLALASESVLCKSGCWAKCNADSLLG